MKDEIFWGNLLGLLKKGRWYLSLEESHALLQIFKEVETRSRPQPLVPQEVVEPVKKEKKAKDGDKRVGTV